MELSNRSLPGSSKGWVMEDGVFIRRPPVPPEILEFAASKNMTVSQVNGQRYLTPNSDTDFVPPSACEVFIGKLPLDCYEPELFPILEEVGPVYQLRLMMKFTGLNRGYAFVKFFNEVQANLAVRMLNNYEIRKGHCIGVTKSVDNRRLLLTGFPQHKTGKEIYDELYPESPGLKYVLIEDPANTRFVCPPELRFATAVYENHGKAAIAFQKMSSDRLCLWGFKIHVGWADPDSPPIATHYYNIFVLRVANLPRDMSTQTIQNKFNEKSNWGVVHVKRYKKNVFIYFKQRNHAEMARDSINRTKIGGRVVRVEWFNAMSVPFSREQRAVHGGTLYKSGAFVQREQKTITALSKMQQQPAAPVQAALGSDQCITKPELPPQPQYQVVSFYYNTVAAPLPLQPNFGQPGTQQAAAGYCLGCSFQQLVLY